MKKVLMVAALAAVLGVALLRSSWGAGEVLFAYYPGLREVDVQGAGGGGTAEIWRSGGKQAIASRPLAADGGMTAFHVPAMEDGDYELRVYGGGAGGWGGSRRCGIFSTRIFRGSGTRWGRAMWCFLRTRR